MAVNEVKPFGVEIPPKTGEVTTGNQTITRTSGNPFASGSAGRVELSAQSTGPSLWGNETVKDLDLTKLSPLSDDTCTLENPKKKQEGYNLGQIGKFFKGLVPKKTAVGEIPNEADLRLAIETAYASNPSFREKVKTIAGIEESMKINEERPV